jgi:hypothetical protein
MAAYETEDATDLRRDWVVHQLKIQHRACLRSARSLSRAEADSVSDVRTAIRASGDAG